MFELTPESTFYSILSYNIPQAVAQITGNSQYPDLQGQARFFSTPYSGVLIEVEVYGLPESMQNPPSESRLSNFKPYFYGMHIHEEGDCTLPFDKTGNHYNPTNLTHPYHIGDLPPLLSSSGYAFTIFYDPLLTIDNIINRSLIIHSQPDDFTSQPAGNSGDKIACGVIQPVRRGNM